MSGGGGGDGEGTIRYAPYLEDAHQDLLDKVSDAVGSALTAGLGGVNPYGEHSPLDLSAGFFGLVDGGGTYEIQSFPSLFDMFGKFMAGFDVCALWGDMYEEVVKGPEISAAVAAHSAILQDDIDTTVMPKFLAGMRDINAIQSSAFVVGKGLISAGHVRSVNEFQSKIRLNAIQLTATLWSRHLDWNSEVSKMYAELFKLYYAAKMDMGRMDMEFDVKDKLWDLGVLDHSRAAIGAMAGAPAAKMGEDSGSSGGGVLGGAMSGAATGAMVGGPWGALIGGIIGAAASFL